MEALRAQRWIVASCRSLKHLSLAAAHPSPVERRATYAALLAPSWLTSAPGVTPSIDLYLRLRDPVPVWRIWSPIVDWLLRRFDDLPGPVLPEVVRTFHLWQLHAPSNAPFRQEIGERALAWLGRIERRDGPQE